MSIEIPGLSARQIDLANRIWSMDSTEEVVAFFDTLPMKARIDAYIVYTMILWAWHAPAAYALALADTTIYWLMQAALLSSAVALWRTILALAAPIGAALAALALTLAQTGLLGALLTFARAPLYAFHHATTWPWGLSPLADQQLAGALMWTLGALPYLAAALALVASRLTPSAPAAPEAAR